MRFIVVMMMVLCAVGADAAEPVFNGAFLELPPPWYQYIYDLPDSVDKPACTRALWRQEIAAMYALGVRTIVIQHTVSDNDMFFDGYCAAGQCAPEELTVSPTDVIHLSLPAILHEAKGRGMQLWVGLRFRDEWDKGWPAVIKDSKDVIRENAAVADAILKSKGIDPRHIAGWYIPQEVDNKQSVSGKKMLSDLTATLKKPVLISAFFRNGISETDFLSMLKETISGSGIHAVLFQDGVGVAGVKVMTKAGIKTVRDRYARVASAAGTMWPVLEVNSCEDCDTPASAKRLRQQAEAASAYTPRIAYEFSEFLSPVTAKTRNRPLLAKVYSQLAPLPNVQVCK